MNNNSPEKFAPSQSALLVAKAIRDDFSCGVIVFDDRKKITALNSEAARLIGLKTTKSLPSLESLPLPLREFFEASLASQEIFQNRHIVLSTTAHAKHPVCVHSATMRAVRGEVTGIVIMLHDLTEALELEQAMRRLDRLASIGTLSASMAHEIKNALVPIKTFVDLLLEKNQDAELGEIVRREMHRIDAIVSQMLRFGGPAKPTFSQTSAHEILEHALRLIQHQLDGKQILLHRSFKASPDLVRGDAYQLEQAFINLLLNALEAMRPHRELFVATEIVASDSERQLRVKIRDTGIGIAATDIPQLFEPFFTTKKHGTGLGLAITRRIIQEHHGTISVESELDKGTTFSIFFPLPDKAHDN